MRVASVLVLLVAAVVCLHDETSRVLLLCNSALAVSARFDCTSDNFAYCGCTYQPQLGAVLLCLEQHAPGSWVDAVVRQCRRRAKIEVTPEFLRASVANASLHAVPGLPLHHVVPPIVFAPVVLQDLAYQRYFTAFSAFDTNMTVSRQLAGITTLYWIVVLAAIGFANHCRTHIHLPALRAHFSTPLLTGGIHKQDTWWGLVPTRMELAVVLGYVAINTYAMAAPYPVYPHNPIFASTTVQYARYMADRAGILAFDHFLMIVLFAGRNNVLIKLTDLLYSTFMAFHRWVGRGMLFFGVFHLLGYLAYVSTFGHIGTNFRHPYWNWGVAATLLCLVLVGLSTYWFRKHYYEPFLVAHIVLAVFFFAACLLHVVLVFGLEAGGSVILVLALWGGDRVIRLYRMWRFGAPKAIILLVNDDTLVVRVPRPALWAPFPGCYVHLYFLHPATAYQSHPFSICDLVLHEREVLVYIKVKNGLTARMRERVLRANSHDRPLLDASPSISMRVTLEGPYGNPVDLSAYSKVVLVAGGLGIPGLFQHALELAHAGALLVKLVWVVRDMESIRCFGQELATLQGTNVVVEVYLTRGRVLPPLPPHVRILSGRPDVPLLVLSAIGNGPSVVVGCGPGILCDQLRSEVAALAARKNPPNVTYLEELQVW